MWAQMPVEVSAPFFKAIGATGRNILRVLGMMQTDGGYERNSQEGPSMANPRL